MKTIGIYLRISVDLEADQDREVMEFHQEKGIKFAENEKFGYEIFEDLRSGFTVDRSGWETLLQKVAARKIGGIWIASLDRFAPDPLDGQVALKIMRWSHCRFWINSMEHDIFDLKTERLLSLV